MNTRFKGKVCVLLGADNPIGLQLVEQFAKAGARLVLSGEHKLSLDSGVSEAMRYGGEAIAAPIDASLKSDYEGILVQTLHAFGRVDYLVLNTGLNNFAPPFMDWSNFSSSERLFNRHVLMPIYGMQLCIPHLTKTAGCIVNISLSNIPIDPQPVSAALEAFISRVGLEFKTSGVKIRCLTVDVQNYSSKTPAIKPAALTNSANSNGRSLHLIKHHIYQQSRLSAASRNTERAGGVDAQYVAQATFNALSSGRATSLQIGAGWATSFRRFCSQLYPGWLINLLYCRCRRGNAKKMQ
mmetsp:Transcript_11387/g.28040  ORF Transcript_11387/g.28040 Transcript_11387/m.28040 type:complete len:296 (-) Transcript_11387:380-1267(-)